MTCTLVYFVAFWVFAIAVIGIRSWQTAVPPSQNLGRSTILKVVPAGLAGLFVLVMRPSGAMFYIILGGAFIFCVLGDIGMDIGLLPGLAFFLAAHFTFTFAFLIQSLFLGLTLPVLLISMGFAFLILLYAVLLLRYINTGLGSLRAPVYIYTITISVMLYSSILLSLVSGTLLGAVVVLGALSFIISDSLIGIREFRRRFPNAVPKVLGTYYIALFLLSLDVVIFIF